MTSPSPTPNLHLQPIEANRRTWADIMNTNLQLIDATVGTYFIVQNLQGPWLNSTAYTVGQAVIDTASSVVYQCAVAHTSAAIPTTFAEDRAAHDTYWGVYSSPARSRGVWMPSTSYALNDFVVSGAQYAICVETHISSATFAIDLADGKWSVLVDLSNIGSSVLPDPGGSGDANKFGVTNSAGTGYTIIAATEALTILGATSIGVAVLQAANQADARTAIGAQAAGSYQPLSTALSTLSGFTIGAFADDLLICGDAATVRTALALTSIATVTPGAGITNFLGTPSATNLRTAVTTTTGTGGLVFASNATMAAPTFTGHVTVPTGTNNTDAVNKTQMETALAAAAPVHRAYALYTISGGVMTLVDNSGLTIARNSNGKFTGTLSPAMPNAKYRVHITTSSSLVAGPGQGEWATLDEAAGGRVSSSSFKVMTRGDNIGVQDPDEIHVDVFWG